MAVAAWSLEMPQDFDEAYEREVEAKGWFGRAVLVADGKRYPLVFFDEVRLADEIARSIENGAAFFESNIVVISLVNRQEMVRAAEMIVKSDQVGGLAQELA